MTGKKTVHVKAHTRSKPSIEKGVYAKRLEAEEAVPAKRSKPYFTIWYYSGRRNAEYEKLGTYPTYDKAKRAGERELSGFNRDARYKIHQSDKAGKSIDPKMYNFRGKMGPEVGSGGRG